MIPSPVNSGGVLPPDSGSGVYSFSRATSFSSLKDFKVFLLFLPEPFPDLGKLSVF